MLFIIFLLVNGYVGLYAAGFYYFDNHPTSMPIIIISVVLWGAIGLLLKPTVEFISDTFFDPIKEISRRYEDLKNDKQN